MQIDLNLENAGADTLAGGITTFGQVFTQGEVSAKAGLVATVNGVDIPVQMDVKTTYADGSVKMAVLSMARPDLPAGAIVDVALSTVASAMGVIASSEANREALREVARVSLGPFARSGRD